VVFAAALLVTCIGVVVWRVFFASPRVPANIVQLSGRIEGDDSAIAPKRQAVL
jgi:hypothetical protein